MVISKSEYMMFLKHPGLLWLKKHDKGKIPVTSAALQAMFDDGNVFESYAVTLFPDSTRVGFESYQEYLTMPSRTREAMQNGATTILQGRVESDNITCIYDVLKKVGDNLFDLYEIKSSAEVKDDHILDLAFQKTVLENSTINIRKIFVIHANTDYERHGDIQVEELTKCKEVTARVNEIMEWTKTQINAASAIASSATPPDFSPRHARTGFLKDWMEVYNNIYPPLHTHPIYKLARINTEMIGELEDMGISKIEEIPDSISLNAKQKIQVEVTKKNVKYIEKAKIQDFLSQLQYPLYFFDYETSVSVIPPYDGIHPHQQVPFQYSLHMKETPDSQPKHMEYLHTQPSNPGLQLIENLQKHIGDKGTILVWYEPFEKKRNEEMGKSFPQYNDFMQSLNSRIVDLMTPFSNAWYADKDFFGSASIKKVLPVLVPELSYKKLDIQEGATASATWTETVIDGKNQDKKEKIFDDLRKYCQLDTLAMVHIYDFLTNLK